MHIDRQQSQQFAEDSAAFTDLTLYGRRVEVVLVVHDADGSTSTLRLHEIDIQPAAEDRPTDKAWLRIFESQKDEPRPRFHPDLARVGPSPVHDEVDLRIRGRLLPQWNGETHTIEMRPA